MGVNIDPVANILIIEEDESLLDIETAYLEKHGYRVAGMVSTKRVESYLAKETVDLLLVGRLLPDIDGCDYVSYLRSKGIVLPVMFVTSKNKDYEVEEGYRCGADDYLRKPFNMNELVYRVKAILRRTSTTEYKRVSARDIVMDYNTRQAFIGNQEVSLTKLEFGLLWVFVKNKGKALERDFLLQSIWKREDGTQKRTVNVAINRLKEKIDPDNVKEYIIPVRGIGYRFNAL